MTVWKSMPEEFPADDQTVWCRRWWFSAPFQAVWSASTQLFTIDAVWTIPWYNVSRWRAL
jgi:hypothetical protein